MACPGRPLQSRRRSAISKWNKNAPEDQYLPNSCRPKCTRSLRNRRQAHYPLPRCILRTSTGSHPNHRANHWHFARYPYFNRRSATSRSESLHSQHHRYRIWIQNRWCPHDSKDFKQRAKECRHLDVLRHGFTSVQKRVGRRSCSGS